MRFAGDREPGAMPNPREEAVPVFYVTAQEGRHRALLAGPFATPEAAEARTEPARQWLASQRFTDTLSAFVAVGTASARPRPGRAAPRGRFNAQIAPELEAHDGR